MDVARHNSAVYLCSRHWFSFLATSFHPSNHLPSFLVALHRSLFSNVSKLLISTFPFLSNFFRPFFFYVFFSCDPSGKHNGEDKTVHHTQLLKTRFRYQTCLHGRRTSCWKGRERRPQLACRGTAALPTNVILKRRMPRSTIAQSFATKRAI